MSERTLKQQGATLSEEAVGRQLAKILDSEVFRDSERMKKFLRFVVQRTLSGQEETLKEYSIAVGAFDKPESFDPRLDPIVRVEAGRLRSKLREYYESAGQQDTIQITLRKRSYVPVFEARHGEERPESHDAIPAAISVEAPEALGVPAAHLPSTSLAVLPFRDISPRRDLGYFCDGITEDLRNALGRLQGVQIVSRTSSQQFTEASGDIREIGRRLNATILLEGSVRRSGTRLRITVQLVSVADGYQHWSGAYDRLAGDILSVQEEIARSVARVLQPQLENPASMLIRPGTQSAQAYELYLRGRFHWAKSTSDSLRRAIKYYRQAALADPRYALPHVGQADCYTSLTWLGNLVPATGWRRALEAAQAALELDNALSQGTACVAAVKAAYEWRWAESEEWFGRAIKLDPLNPIAHQWYATFCLAPQRRLEEAVLEMARAQDLDRASPLVSMQLGCVLYLARRYEEAIAQYLGALRLDPFFYLTHCYMGFAYVQLNRLDNARAAFERAHELSGGESMTMGALGYLHGIMGKTDEASRILSQLQTLARKRYVSPLDAAAVYVGLGKMSAALEAAERAYETRCSRMTNLPIDPLYDKIRSEPRFLQLLVKMGLGPSTLEQPADQFSSVSFRFPAVAALRKP